ncbi:transcriptional regulator with XRE-family HTH domain [Thermocatellispora tengchongensis]|uniref:Transcriptional regulator with XRE-family HTH domain n=1 Tax=Thermocatellispora tengchongensis TaxID=1073253 RepID=A0A840P3E9_9ACTN|nr:XRE family transcriptional regulator [Thermocatellispora tengchongensis]MBB5134208.1 transcriptional regulator with XRE-family HTH domain [Thermocatellispora tengchongensis]
MTEYLRNALARARLTPADVATHLAVDPKTVDRWLKGRTPYQRHRWTLADLLGVDEADLWPDVASRRLPVTSEVRAVYPHRWAVPRAVWHRHFQSATKEIAILAYSGLFLAEDTGLLHLLADQARAGVRVRILLGDPDSPPVAARGEEEAIGPEVMAARIRNALTLYRPLTTIDGVELRLHRTVLYTSIYRADDDLLVNPHVYGTPAPKAPVLHLTATPGPGAATTYLDSYEHVWSAAQQDSS